MTGLTKKAAADIVGGALGTPSKMPGKSYGLSALDCKRGTKLRDVAGSTCADCYAMKNAYTWPAAKRAHARRLESLRHPDWTDAMVRLLEGETWFRWHDSGDLQGVWHLAQIVAVARRTPNVNHWLPTRELGQVRAWLCTPDGAEGFPANLRIRISATMVDGKAPNAPAGCSTSTVHDQTSPAGFLCGAAERGGQCGDCRVCWSDTPNVSYHLH